MAATDTVVGIVGAVLLAGVMVTVFAVEYTNTPSSGGPPTPAAKAATFHALHPALNATDDLDGDGTPNVNDTDLDGNGVEDVNQTGEFNVHAAFSDTWPGPPATSYTHDVAVKVGSGEQTLRANLTWTVVAIPLSQAPPVPNFSFQLLGPDGKAVGSSGNGVTNGSSRSASLVAAAPLDRGTYTLRVTMDQAGPSTPLQLDAWLDYGPAHAPPKDTVGPKA